MMKKGQRKGGNKKKRVNNNKSSGNSRPKLRFKYGDRVDCNVGGWQSGTVVKCWYDTEISEEDGVFREGVPGLVVPYQMLLDDGGLVYAPHDDDYYIQKSDSPPWPIEHPTGSRIECLLGHRSERRQWGEKWRLGTVIGTDEDWAERGIYPYTILFDDDEKVQNYLGPKEMIRRAPLRFGVGDRVELKRGDKYLPGTVVRLWAKSDFWEEGGVVPYEVRLDSGHLHSLTTSDNESIKSSDLPHIPVTSFTHGDRVECKEDETEELWRQGVVIQSNEDWVERDCPPFFIRFDDGENDFFYGPNIRASDSVPQIPVSDALAKLGLSDDDSLFDTPPPMPDCPICFLPMPIEDDAYTNKACCGQTVCSGCEQAHWNTMGMEKTCPFCRAPESRPNDETLDMMKKRVELGDAENTFCLGCFYDKGINGLPEDKHTAHQLFVRAADLGSLRACTNAAVGYRDGKVVEKDDAKSMYYLEKGAKLGQVKARFTLGELAGVGGEWDLAFRHWKISACAGFQPALDRLKTCYKDGMLSKEVYTECLRSSQKTKAAAWSKDREIAAVARKMN